MELWAADEHRPGLPPVVRRVWAPEGRRPVAPVRLAFLPADPPEPRPAERPWGPVDGPATNRAFAAIEGLEGTLADRCRVLERQRQTLKSRCRDRWWPRERRPGKNE